MQDSCLTTMSTAADHYWWCYVGIGVLIAGTVLFNIILIWAHQYLGGNDSHNHCLHTHPFSLRASSAHRPTQQGLE